MTFNTNALKKRLDVAERIIRPPGSLAARIEALRPELKAKYRAWQQDCEIHATKYKGREEDLYKDVLAMSVGEEVDDPPPQLCPYIDRLLFPPPDPNADPQEEYMKLLNEGK